MNTAKFCLALFLAFVLGTPVVLADEKKNPKPKTAEKTGPGYDKTYEACLARFKKVIAAKDVMTMTEMSDPEQVAWSKKMAKGMIENGKKISEFKQAIEKKFPLISLFKSKENREFYMYFYMMSSMEQMGQMMSGKRPVGDELAHSKLTLLSSKKVKDYYVVTFQDENTKTKKKEVDTVHMVQVGKYWRIFFVSKRTGKRGSLNLKNDPELQKMYLMVKHAEMLQKDFANLKAQLEAGKFKKAEDLGQVIVKLMKDSRKKLEGQVKKPAKKDAPKKVGK